MRLRSRSVGGLASALGEAASRSAQDLQTIQQKVRPGHKPTLLEKLGVLWYVASYGGGIYGLILCIWLCTRLPLLWPVFIAYAIHVWTTGAAAHRRGTWPAPFRRWALWRAMARYFPAALHKTVDLPAGRPYIFCFHPHGIYSFSAWLTFATDALGFSRLFPGIDARLLTLQLNFKGPIMREYLLLSGVCDVSAAACQTLLRRGKSLAVVVGGGSESLYAKPGSNDLVLLRRKGLVRIALRAGAPLVPVYAFGENSLYRTANELPPGSLLRRVQRRLTKLMGFTVPLFWGRGLVLPWGLLPYPVPLDVVVGAPLEVQRFEGDESSAEFAALVDATHARYVAALQALFDAHKAKFAQGDAELRLVE